MLLKGTIFDLNRQKNPMHNAFIPRLLILFSTIFVLQSCVDDAKKAAMILEQAENIQSAAKEIDIADDAQSTDPALQSHFKISYPEINEVLPPAVADSIERLLATFIAASEEPLKKLPDVNQLAKDFFAERAEVASEFDNEVPWTMDRKVSIVGKLGNLLSFELMESSYMGGAHPNSFIIYKVVDLSTGQVVKLYDLLDRSKKPTLDRLRLEQLEADKLAAGAEADWKSYFFEDSFLPDGSFYKNDNFRVGPEGITFLYNSYEIAAYAFGRTEVTIPLRTIQPLVRVESPYLKLF
jgi:hypothetical protein